MYDDYQYVIEKGNLVQRFVARALRAAVYTGGGFAALAAVVFLVGGGIFGGIAAKVIVDHDNHVAAHAATWREAKGTVVSDPVPCGKGACADVRIGDRTYPGIQVPSRVNGLETRNGFRLDTWSKGGHLRALRPATDHTWGSPNCLWFAFLGGALFTVVSVFALEKGLDAAITAVFARRVRTRLEQNHTKQAAKKPAKKGKPALWSNGSRSWA